MRVRVNWTLMLMPRAAGARRVRQYTFVSMPFGVVSVKRLGVGDTFPPDGILAVPEFQEFFVVADII
jgi:hypothetical protein